MAPDGSGSRIYYSRINREMGDLFGSEMQHEKEIAPGLHIRLLCDTDSGRFRETTNESSNDYGRLRRRKGNVADQLGVKDELAKQLIATTMAVGSKLQHMYSMNIDAEQKSLTSTTMSYCQSVDQFNNLKDKGMFNDQVIVWNPAGGIKEGLFDLYKSQTSIGLIQSEGIRFLVRFSKKYFESWGINIPNDFFQSPPFIHSRTDQTITNTNQLIPDDYNICSCVIEIPDSYPMKTPSIAVVHLQVQQTRDWYLAVSRNVFSFLHLYKYEKLDLKDVQQTQHLIRDPLPLARLSSSLLTEYVIGEVWMPSISLEAVLTRLSATVREQIISHVAHADRQPLVKRSEAEMAVRIPSKTASNLKTPFSLPSDDIKPHVNGFDYEMPSQNLNGMISNYHSCEREGSRLSGVSLHQQKTWLSLWLILLMSVAVRVLLGNQPHSGQYNLPIYGDYEAHRHWKELTNHLPLGEWYTYNGFRSDNQGHANETYWPLDYPPLIAYQEYLLGRISLYLDPQSVSFTNASRGYLTASHKLFMRWTVLIPDLLIFHTAAIFFWAILPDQLLVGRSDIPTVNSIWSRLMFKTATGTPRLISLGLFLCCPVFVVVDHGHFQYNCVALGLVLWAVNCIAMGQQALGVIFFGAATLYKQTMLYFSPSIVFFLVGINLYRIHYHGWLTQKRGRLDSSSTTKRLSQLVAVAVVFGFVVCLPFILYETEMHIESKSFLEKVLVAMKLSPLIHIIRRIFPFHRGIYEDYVSNVWVTLQPIFKINKICQSSSKWRQISFMLCIGMTIASFSPSCLLLIKKPTFNRFRYCLISSSLAFYLFSAQVHEKAILLPVMAALLCLPVQYEFAVMFAFIGSFSLLHLMIKDFIVAPFLGLLILWTLGVIYFRREVKKWNACTLDLDDLSPGMFAKATFNAIFEMLSPSVWRELVFEAIVFVGRVLTAAEESNERLLRLLASSIIRRTPKEAESSFQYTNIFPVSIWESPLVRGSIIFTSCILMLVQVTIPAPQRYPYLHVYLQSMFCCALFLLAAASVFNFQYATETQPEIDVLSPVITKVMLSGPAPVNVYDK